jgi:hypothetical protein
MPRFGPTRSEHRFRLGVSLFGLALLAGAYATNGIGGIASLEIAIIAGRFSAARALVGKGLLQIEGDRGMSGALIFRLVLLVLVAIAWAWLAFRAVDRGRRLRRVAARPGNEARPQHAGLPDLRACGDGGDAGPTAGGLSLPLHAGAV